MRIPNLRAIHPVVIEHLLEGQDIFSKGSVAGELMLLAGDTGSMVLAGRAALAQVSMPPTGVMELPSLSINDGLLHIPEVEGPKLVSQVNARLEHARSAWKRELPTTRKKQERKEAEDHRIIECDWAALTLIEAFNRLPAQEMEPLCDLMWKALNKGVSNVIYTWGWCMHQHGELTTQQAREGPELVTSKDDSMLLFETRMVMKLLTTKTIAGHVLWRAIWREITSTQGPFGPSLFSEHVVFAAALTRSIQLRDKTKALGALQEPKLPVPGAEAVAWAMAEALQRFELMTTDAFMPEELHTEYEPEEGLTKMQERWMYQQGDRQKIFQSVFERAVEATELTDPLGPLFCCNMSQRLAIGCVSVVLDSRFEILESIQAKTLSVGHLNRINSWVQSQLNRFDGTWPDLYVNEKGSLWDGIHLEELAWLRNDRDADWRAAEVLRPMLYASVRALLEGLQLLQSGQSIKEVYPWIVSIYDPAKIKLRLRQVLIAAAPAAAKWSAASEVDKQGFRHATVKGLDVSLEEFDAWMDAQPFDLQQLQIRALSIHQQPSRIEPCGGAVERLNAPENFTPPWMIRGMRLLEPANVRSSTGAAVKRKPSPQT